MKRLIYAVLLLVIVVSCASVNSRKIAEQQSVVIEICTENPHGLECATGKARLQEMLK